MKTRTIVVGILVAAYLVGLGVLSGIALDRMLFDRQRAEVLGRYEEAIREWHAVRIDRPRAPDERAPVTSPDGEVTRGASAP